MAYGIAWHAVWHRHAVLSRIHVDDLFMNGRPSSHVDDTFKGGGPVPFTGGGARSR